MKKKIVTLGEILLRLSPANNQKIMGAKAFEVNYGGAELNVAVNLSLLGIDTVPVTKVPENEIGEAALGSLKSYGVDTSKIILGGERLGAYFLENGYSLRNSKVIYDRKYSAFSLSNIAEYNIEEILKGADLFHVSGITLALGKNTFEIAEAFMKKAKEMSIPVSFDFNYRSKLWTLEESSKGIESILKYVDIAFAGHLDFINILRIEREYTGNDIQELYSDLYPKVMEKYDFKYIVSSSRETLSANKNNYRGLMYNGKEILLSREYQVDIIDRVGSGDAFTSGFLYSFLQEKEDTYKINFAAASAVIKHTIHGDVNNVRKYEIENLFQNDSFDVSR